MEENKIDNRTEIYLGTEKYQIIQNSTITVVGAGAIGNEVIKNLGLLGIKKIKVIDYDQVDETNLDRCIFFTPNDVDNNKSNNGTPGFDLIILMFLLLFLILLRKKKN